MGPIRAEVDIDAPREQIFAFLSDLANRPAFTDHFISELHVSRLDASGAGAGARFRLRLGRRAVWMDSRIEEVERPRRIVERGHGGRGNRKALATVWELLEGPGSLTTVRVTFWTESPQPLDRLRDALFGAARKHRRNWKIALRRLRDTIESGKPASGRVEVGGRSRLPTLLRG